MCISRRVNRTDDTSKHTYEHSTYPVTNDPFMLKLRARARVCCTSSRRSQLPALPGAVSISMQCVQYHRHTATTATSFGRSICYDMYVTPTTTTTTTKRSNGRPFGLQCNHDARTHATHDRHSHTRERAHTHTVCCAAKLQWIAVCRASVSLPYMLQSGR